MKHTLKKKRYYRKYTRKKSKKKGGFVPSVGEGFCIAVGKYIAPLVLYTGYKFISSPTLKRHKENKGKMK